MAGLAAQLSEKGIAQLARTISAENADTACRSMVGFIGDVVRCDCALVVIYDRDRAPTLLHDALNHPKRENTAQHYIETAYLLDPFYRFALSLDRSMVVRMRDVGAEADVMEAYRRAYYQASAICDEINFLVPLMAQRVAAICIERVAGASAFSNAEIASLRRILPLVEALVRRILAKSADVVATNRRAPRILAERLIDFRGDVLTRRECEVARGLLLGQSAAQLAEILDISVETCRVHRRNVYAKLGISSLGELFAMALTWLENDDIPDRQSRA